jgi:hypothetical protein
MLWVDPNRLFNAMSMLGTTTARAPKVVKP